MDLIARHRVTAETVKRWQGRAFAWGKADCVRLVVCHLGRCGLPSPLGKAGTWGSAVGAAKALQRMGHASVADALDALGLPRITPARAMVGDIVALPSEDHFDALGIVLGNGRVLAWIGGDADQGCAVLQPLLPPATVWQLPL